MMDSTAVVIVLAVCAALGAVALWFYMSRGAQAEHFTSEHDAKTDADGEPKTTTEDGYTARLQTIRVFEMITNRKPTVDEIEKYSKIGNEQDILLKVLQDFKPHEKFENDGERKEEQSTSPAEEEQFTAPASPVDREVLMAQLGRIQESVDLMKAAINKPSS